MSSTSRAVVSHGRPSAVHAARCHVPDTTAVVGVARPLMWPRFVVTAVVVVASSYAARGESIRLGALAVLLAFAATVLCHVVVDRFSPLRIGSWQSLLVVTPDRIAILPVRMWTGAVCGDGQSFPRALVDVTQRWYGLRLTLPDGAVVRLSVPGRSFVASVATATTYVADPAIDVPRLVTL